LSKIVLVVTLVAVTTFLLRLLPFVLFPKGKQPPRSIDYLGGVLPFAIITMLIVYCIKGNLVWQYPYAIPEIFCIALVALLHRRFKNNLISICVGTGIYMFLLQVVFV